MSFKIRRYEFESKNGDKYEFLIEDTQFSLLGEDNEGDETFLAVFEKEDIGILIEFLIAIRDG